MRTLTRKKKTSVILPQKRRRHAKRINETICNQMEISETANTNQIIGRLHYNNDHLYLSSHNHIHILILVIRRIEKKKCE